MYKNICFIPIQLARLRQCSVAARMQSKYDDGGGAPEGAPGTAGAPGSVAKGPHLPRSAAAVVALEDMAADELPLFTREEETPPAAKRRQMESFWDINAATAGGGALRERGAPRDKGGPPYKPLRAQPQPDGPPGSDSNNHSHHPQQQHQQQERYGRGHRDNRFRGLAFWRKVPQRERETTESTLGSVTDYEARYVSYRLFFCLPFLYLLSRTFIGAPFVVFLALSLSLFLSPVPAAVAVSFCCSSLCCLLVLSPRSLASCLSLSSLPGPLRRLLPFIAVSY